MKRVCCAFLITILIGLLVAPFSPADSADCEDSAKIFSSVYDVNFLFNEQGTADVSQKISLKNLSGSCFASEYNLKINSTKIKDVSGKDSLGPLTINLSKDNTSTIISARLNDEVVGKDRTVGFELHYTIEGLATKEGFIWSLLAPKIVTSETPSAFSLKVVVPETFGRVFTVSPTPDNIVYEKGQTVLDFGRKEAAPSHVFASFGAEQEISFKFRVPLENRRFLSQRFFINLPPDTEKQQVLIKRVNPAPEKIIVGSSGNYSACYKIAGRKTVEVVLEGTVKIIGNGRNFTSPVIFSESEIASLASGSSDFIQVQDRLIQAKAKELKTAEAIYKFVVNYLSFDAKAASSGKAERKGAANLLRKKELATNVDFVDLFVAIARAAGIPTREVFGFTIGGDQTLKPSFIAAPLNTNRLHVWAQIYDYQKKSWVNVDPTWGNTSSVDYFEESLPDRVALFFSSRGEDTLGLKNLTASSKNSEIFTNSEKGDFSAKIDLTVDANQIVAGFPSEVIVRIENKSGVSATGGKIKVEATNVSLMGKNTVVVPVILPYEKKIYKFKVSAGNRFESAKGAVKVGFEAESGDAKISLSKQENVLVKSFFSFGLQQALFIILVFLLIIGIVASKLKSRGNK